MAGFEGHDVGRGVMPEDRALLDPAITRAAAWLRAQLRFGGRFEYGYYRNGRAMQRYNVARHAGTLYAMAQHYERDSDQCNADAYSAASRYLAVSCVRAVPGRDGQFAPWCDAEGEPRIAKLGAAGLALAAWCVPSDGALWRPPDEILQGIGRFIVAMQHEDGRFVSKYDAIKGYDERWHSLYYPGEAALGLIRLHGIDGDPVWLDAAEAALLQLARKREKQGVYEPDHWALLATEALWPLALERKTLSEHALGIVEAILAHRQASGALTACGRLTPTAVRLEGMLAVRSLLPPGNALERALSDSLPHAVLYLLDAQRAAPPQVGAFPRAPGAVGDPRGDELRIDYTQHALSALLAYRDGQTHLASSPAIS